MEEPFLIEQTKKTPYIFFDPDNGVLEVSGFCLPDNSQNFFQPLFEVVDKYLGHPQPVTELVFSLEYVNTSSSKLILQLLKKFETLIIMGKEATFTWFIDADDFDMHDAGKIYEASIKMPTQILVKDDG